MKKKKAQHPQNAGLISNLFVPRQNPRRRALILPRYLSEEANMAKYRGKKQDNAWQIIGKWVALAAGGHLFKKETAVDADFLLDVFGRALGFTPATESPEKYHLERNFTVPGVGTADGALGVFGPHAPPSPVAVIELKDADTDLDRDKFNGRTPVQQCWDYLNALPQCPWGIVSNFVSTRLYHRDKTPLAYQEFLLKDLAKKETFLVFWCLFELGGLLETVQGPPRATLLLQRTENRQREVGDELYNQYSDNRFRLIEHLHRVLGKPVDEAIRIAQKILDRIVFIAFCEDRGLLPENSIDLAYNYLPPFSKVTNPRWRNFLNLFSVIDKGSERDLGLEHGYNGGLFRDDPAVDDLQLDDDWTNFFRAVGRYDFRDEVNVEVLGRLFEKSIGELEGLRTVGLFGIGGPATPGGGPQPAMPKSPERKRFGIYYTPPDFTQFIVQQTVGTLVKNRLADLQHKHQLQEADLQTDRPSAPLAAYWRAGWEALRQIKVCDPACGSGAFLIQAYDLLEEQYGNVADQLAFHEGPAAETLAERISDTILAENLFGVDLSEQAVEITQLALWIRSARRGKTLADLSRNIVWGNSLVTDPTVHPRALNWREQFAGVFARDHGGFDCVIGNPPWERLKLQEREFFAFSAPAIAGAVSAAQRRELIARLEQDNPELHERYRQAQKEADDTLAHVRTSGEFPLTARGDINTYMLFAELARKLVAPTGRVGLLVPSGIATDNTTKDFFATLMDSQALTGLYDFENKLYIFPDVDGRFKFSVLLFGGTALKTAQSDFVFFAHRMDDLKQKQRHISLSSADLARLNPNSRTCPIFRTRRDAELTKAVYSRVPILVDHSRDQGGNPWGVRFVRMFDQTNDAELFCNAGQLRKKGYKHQGNRWVKGKQVFLPLYEAKMVQAYDHRAASVVIASGNWVRQGQTEDTTLVAHQNPEFVAQPRWWVDSGAIPEQLVGRQDRGFIGFKDITSPTNQRTMIAAAIPWTATTNHFVLALTDAMPRCELCFLANLNAIALDYIARQKIGGITLNFFIVEQLPIFPPDHFGQRCPWNKRQTLEKWISDRVLKLTCTANDMKPLAETVGFDPPVHKWNPAERADLLAELDAAFLLLYGIDREDAEYVLGTFRGLQEQEPLLPGVSSTASLILEAYDRLLEQSSR